MLTQAGVKIRSEYCSKCSVCSSICPFEAIFADEKTGELVIDIEKCRICGLCFSSCPSSAIDIAYYDRDSLVNYVKERIRETGMDKLVVRCQSAPLDDSVKDRLKRHGMGEYITLRVPCVGRVPPDFALRMLAIGVRKMAIIPCKGENCRFERGSNIGLLRFSLTRNLLGQLGLEEETLIVIRNLVRAHVDANRCIECGNCIYTCPYNAVHFGSPGAAQVDENACWGCGACVAVCPALAISLDEFNHRSLQQSIIRYAQIIREMKQKNCKPAVLVLHCQWANFPPLNGSGNYSDGNIALLELPCSSAFDPMYVIQALHEGFDGVLIAACKKGECRFEEGNELAEKRMLTLKKLLAQLNLESRVELCFISSKYLGEFDDNVKLFVNRLKPM
ncbi:MAG: hydrogenase iron-sulfur subunit [Candidatus Bathyarchaeota archaeon]|nr:hydrogenase iron-sulfur subunit [Candidatus Bathyarchaeota archaeon]MCX8177073.1 hydrogenase iron-sulfur subunit [Candidatus Bathyarchaeota archaeon]MDW8194188.1 hydrogenase iron-sulfur subunit [Nitrososphaerota archaeon]